MNILFLCVALPNLETDNGLFAQLINEFARHNHHICVSAKGNGIRRTQLFKENGVDVLRIKAHDFTGVSNNIKKALAYQEYSIKQRYFTKKFFKKERFDLIISHSLPPELAYIIRGLKKFFKCPFYLIQSDYTWQDAVGFGYFSEKHPVAKYYQYWEKRTFELADYIGCPTKGNFEFIKKYYPNIPEDKFDFLPFWMNELDIKPDSNLRQVLGLEGKFVVIYGGSVGAAQRVDHVISLAEMCKSYNDIVFVILGRGPMLEQIKKSTRDKGLENVIFKDYLPQAEYLLFMASCDAGMIILNENLGTPNFPSKALSYLNMKVPILAALDYVTDFGDYLDENNAGLWAYSDNIAELKSKLLIYYNDFDLRSRVRENGYKLFKEHLTTDRAYQTIMNKVK